MKHLALSLVALLAWSATAVAQDDVYFVPSKKKQQSSIDARHEQARTYSQENNAFEYDDWAEHRSSYRDVDEYNRRSTRKARGAADSLDLQDEPSMTARIVRFRSPRGVLVASPWYDTYYYDLATYDPWFHHWGWSSWYGYYDPWYSGWSWGISYSPWFGPSLSWGWRSPYYAWSNYWGWSHWGSYYNPWYSGWSWGGYTPYWSAPAARNYTYTGPTRGSNIGRSAFGGRGESFGSRNGGGHYESRGQAYGSRSGSRYDLRSSGVSTRSGNSYTPSRSSNSYSPSRSGVVSGSRGGSYSPPANSYSAPARSSFNSGGSFNSGSRGGFNSGGSAPSRSGVVGGRR